MHTFINICRYVFIIYIYVCMYACMYVDRSHTIACVPRSACSGSAVACSKHLDSNGARRRDVVRFEQKGICSPMPQLTCESRAKEIFMNPSRHLGCIIIYALHVPVTAPPRNGAGVCPRLLCSMRCCGGHLCPYTTL